MDIYQWKCGRCGYIRTEPRGTTQKEAIENKRMHIEACKPRCWSSPIKKTPEDMQSIRIVII